MSARKRSTEWWMDHFDATYLREWGPVQGPVTSRQEVARLLELLGLPAGAKVLDCACGQGRHAHLMAEAGLDVTGVDYSADLLAAARKRGTGPGLQYVQGDMRALPPRWTRRFHGVVNLFTSFGFFLQQADDAKAMAEMARVLKPGGVLVWNGGDRDGIAAKLLSRDWWLSEAGTMIGQERDFDALSGILTVRSTWRGPQGAGERTHRIRLYTPTQMADLMASVGLIVESAFDGWREKPLTRRTTEMTLVARRVG
ncbi:MAG: class I SAM-dependent methyltransferase [Gemmatimonadetes bacterium]|nr:class I SAM-dependent methyltransferase [Gemmatimonadota bacterium]